MQLMLFRHTNKKNLDVQEIILHGNPKPDSEIPYISTSKERLIKEDHFLTLVSF